MEEFKQLFTLYPLDEKMQMMKDGEKIAELNVFRLPERGDRVQFGGQWYEVVRYAYEQNKDGSRHYETPVLKPMNKCSEDRPSAIKDINIPKEILDKLPKKDGEEWVDEIYVFTRESLVSPLEQKDNMFTGFEFKANTGLHRYPVKDFRIGWESWRREEPCFRGVISFTFTEKNLLTNMAESAKEAGVFLKGDMFDIAILWKDGNTWWIAYQSHRKMTYEINGLDFKGEVFNETVMTYADVDDAKVESMTVNGNL